MANWPWWVQSDNVHPVVPMHPYRYGGALFTTLPPGTASVAFTLSPGTMYVARCSVLQSGNSFQTIKWPQVKTSPTGVTNAFWALYDVNGGLVSSTTATDCSAAWMSQGVQSYTLD